jgi:hypothetical protein
MGGLRNLGLNSAVAPRFNWGRMTIKRERRKRLMKPTKIRYEEQFSSFAFPGFIKDGRCFLRVRVAENGSAVFLCAQLYNYHGTSVTNRVEVIYEKAIAELIHKNVWQKSEIPGNASSGRKLAIAMRQRMRWVEHYPPGTTYRAEGSYALVSFDDLLNPRWTYVSRERAAEICDVEEKFLKVASKDLRNEG